MNQPVGRLSGSLNAKSGETFPAQVFRPGHVIPDMYTTGRSVDPGESENVSRPTSLPTLPA